MGREARLKQLRREQRAAISSQTRGHAESSTKTVRSELTASGLPGQHQEVLMKPHCRGDVDPRKLLEIGWPLHHVQEMLGHANVSQTSTYLNATRVGLQDSMRRFSSKRVDVGALADPPVTRTAGTEVSVN